MSQSNSFLGISSQSPQTAISRTRPSSSQQLTRPSLSLYNFSARPTQKPASVEKACLLICCLAVNVLLRAYASVWMCLKSPCLAMVCTSHRYPIGCLSCRFIDINWQTYTVNPSAEVPCVYVAPWGTTRNMLLCPQCFSFWVVRIFVLFVIGNPERRFMVFYHILLKNAWILPSNRS
jgi:hypothetical protein